MLPFYPGGYNFARSAYYDKIGAVGFAVGKLKIISEVKSNFLQTQVNDFKAVIPGKTLNEVNKIMTDSYDSVTIGIAKNQSSKLSVFKS